MTPCESLLHCNNGSSTFKQLVLMAFLLLQYTLYIYTDIFSYWYIGQSFKEVNLRDIKKVKKSFLHDSYCVYRLFWLCYECNNIKGKSRKYVCADHLVKKTKKITVNYHFSKKMNSIKGIQSPCQKCMDKLFDPYFYTLMN